MNKKYKIGYFADGPWAHQAFKKLINDSTIEIAFICGRFNSTDTVLQQNAIEYGIDYITEKNINTQQFLDKISTYNCDLLVSMSFDQIFKTQIIQLCPHKIINCHAGKLPFYRGRNVLNWLLINDEKELGITVHFVDEGIDTGDIILQKTYPVTDDDTYATILEKAHVYCAEVLYEAIVQLKDDNYSITKQSDIDKVGFYCGKREIGDEIIDWKQESREIFNFVRAICKPGPMAQSFINGKQIMINKASMIAGAPIYKCTPGLIVGLDNDCFIVKTNDTVIKVDEYYYEGKIKIGDRLKNE